jgi:hypothetical protein
VPQLPRVARPVVSLKLPTFCSCQCQFSFIHDIPRGDSTHYRKNVGIILGNPEYAVGTFELVNKLGGVSSWVDLPDLGHVDQSGQNLAVGPDR